MYTESAYREREPDMNSTSSTILSKRTPQVRQSPLSGALNSTSSAILAQRTRLVQSVSRIPPNFEWTTVPFVSFAKFGIIPQNSVELCRTLLNSAKCCKFCNNHKKCQQSRFSKKSWEISRKTRGNPGKLWKS